MYRNPNDCPHTVVALNRRTGEQRCGECGTVVVPGQLRQSTFVGAGVRAGVATLDSVPPVSLPLLPSKEEA